MSGRLDSRLFIHPVTLSSDCPMVLSFGYPVVHMSRILVFQSSLSLFLQSSSCLVIQLFSRPFMIWMANSLVFKETMKVETTLPLQKEARILQFTQLLAACACARGNCYASARFLNFDISQGFFREGLSSPSCIGPWSGLE